MSPLPSVLTPEQIQHFQEYGYVIVPDLLTAEEVSAFVAHEEAYRPCSQYGLQGHRSDPQYQYMANHPKIAGAAMQIQGGPVRIVQTMALMKPPQGGKGIALHQDSHYLPNEPNTLMACWLALSDTSPENGGLCIVPGSHHRGLRGAHKTQNEQEHAAWEHEYEMRDPDGREWKQRMYSFEVDDLDPGSIVRLTVPRGGGVFFTGRTIHGSFANRSEDQQRKAWAVHYIRADTWLFRQDVQDAVPVTL